MKVKIGMILIASCVLVGCLSACTSNPSDDEIALNEAEKRSKDLKDQLDAEEKKLRETKELVDKAVKTTKDAGMEFYFIK